jgi:hypothetical protein
LERLRCKLHSIRNSTALSERTDHPLPSRTNPIVGSEDCGLLQARLIVASPLSVRAQSGTIARQRAKKIHCESPNTRRLKRGSRRRPCAPGPLAATTSRAAGGAAAESPASATPALGTRAPLRCPAVPGAPAPAPRGDLALRDPCLQIVSEIHEIADQILHLPYRIPDAFRRGRLIGTELCESSSKRTGHRMVWVHAALRSDIAND